MGLCGPDCSPHGSTAGIGIRIGRKHMVGGYSPGVRNHDPDNHLRGHMVPEVSFQVLHAEGVDWIKLPIGNICFWDHTPQCNKIMIAMGQQLGCSLCCPAEWDLCHILQMERKIAAIKICHVKLEGMNVKYVFDKTNQLWAWFTFLISSEKTGLWNSKDHAITDCITAELIWPGKNSNVSWVQLWKHCSMNTPSACLMCQDMSQWHDGCK